MTAPPPFSVEHRLPGWTLAWVELAQAPGAEEAAAGLRAAVAERCRSDRRLDTLAAEPVVAAVRRLFREAGTDPTRYRPSSEALIRRLLKGEELPAIHPLVDLNNALSVTLAVPCCVMATGTVDPPLVLRSGEPGERMASLRGDFDLGGKPLLADAAGPFGTPITDSERVKVGAGTSAGWMVAYLPAGEVGAAELRRALDRDLDAARLAATSEVFVTGG
jgi:DNA/RNA-binding domain of Phe-tRNA-synthetase-like protein